MKIRFKLKHNKTNDKYKSEKYTEKLIVKLKKLLGFLQDNQ